MLDVQNLSVNYGHFRALHGLDLTVNPGEIVVLLGANGAGKSTLFRTLAGLQRPSGGSATWNGTPLTGGRPELSVSRGVSLCPEGRLLFPELSVEKNLRLGAYTHRRDRAGTEQELGRVYGLFPALVEKRNAPAGSLSGGQQQMVAIGRALMARPALLLLDEPTAGMTAQETAQTAELIRSLAGKHAVLVIDHDMQFVELLAAPVTVLHQGQVFREGDLDHLRNDPDVMEIYLGRPREAAD